jgi:choline dehydrogenase-like flavoprotein
VSTTLETQVVVIGSGAGGAAVAGELVRHGLPTVVVEAGPQETEPLGSHVRNRDPSEFGLSHYNDALTAALTFPSGGAAAGSAFGDFKVIHALGGMFTYWTCNCPTPHPAELAPWIGEKEWFEILQRSRNLLGVGYDLGAGSLRQERLIERVAAVVKREETGREVQPMPVAASRIGGRICFSSTEHLLRCNGRSDILDLRPDLICRKILQEGGRATGVVARRRQDGEELVIHSQTVVVAAGVIGTPKLIAGSRIDAGPALGAYVFDHPAIGSRVVLRRDILSDVPDDDPVFTVWIPYEMGRPWHNQICRFPTNPNALDCAAGPNETADIFTFSAMDVRSTNRFEFDLDRLDPFGLPEVVGSYSLSSADYERLSRGLDEHLRIAAAIGDLIAHRWAPTFFGPGWSTHLMGTCRMGPSDDGTSCADTFGRLWGYENIYVAGNAVFAVSNAGNPTLTTVALALRTADSIVASLVSSRRQKTQKAT